MKRFFEEKRGMALVTVLMVLILLVMMITAISTLHSNSLLYSLNYINKISALSAAEQGVAYAIYELQENPSWAPLDFVYNTDAGVFKINFNDSTDPYSSCNNLTSSTVASGEGFDGADVDEYSVDLIVTGYSGNTVKRIRVLINRASIKEAGRSTGIADIEAGIFEITRLVTADDPSVNGTFHSNSSEPNAICADANTQVFAYGGIISAVGGIDIPNYDTSNGTVLNDGAEVRPIPEININEIVTNAGSDPNVYSMIGGEFQVRQDSAGGGYYLSRKSAPTTAIPLPAGSRIEEGTLIFTQDVYFEGNTTFEFVTKDGDYRNAGIEFEETGDFYPSLYINGTNPGGEGFWVLGKVVGNGAIYNTGSTKFIMETSVVGSADTGTALLSQDDINIKLPASTGEAIDLSLTGAVLTYGNLNATVMDMYDPDNPCNYLDAADAWPENWVEQAYCDYGTGSEFVDGSITIPMAGPPPLNSGGTWQIVIEMEELDEDPTTGTIHANGDGSFSWSGLVEEAEIKLYKDGNSVYHDNDDDIDISSSSAVIPGDFTYGSMPSDWEFYSGLSVDGVSYSGHNQDLVDYVCGGLNTYFGGSGGGGGEATAADLYAPNVTVTGALIVADPNNLDGSGSHNTDSGNIQVNLTGPQNKGDFKLIYANNYEKLLASPEINLKLKLNTWEELP